MSRYLFFKAGTVIAAFFVIVLLLPSENGCCGWFQQSDETLLRKALNSDNPGKVESCLDTFIKKQNYSAILQIKQHAKRMLQAERRSITLKHQADPAVIKKRLAPWKQIELKADQFFTRTTVQQKGKNTDAP
jgi:hypothetical protein